MAFEFILLAALIFIFLVSFCGLLQKIKQTYDRERLIAERIARRRERSQRSSGSSFDYQNDGCTNDGGVFPGGPPAYTEFYMEPPPKYDDVVKIHVVDITQVQQDQGNRPIDVSAPPPYSITVQNNTGHEISNR